MTSFGNWHLHTDPSFIKLAQTDQLILGGLDYNGYLFFIADQTALYLGEFFHDDPTIGIISQDNTWAIIGGYMSIAVWTPEKITHHMLSEPFACRQISPSECYILTDPWLDNPAIYHYDIPTHTLKKVAPFTDYIGRPRTRDVIW